MFFSVNKSNETKMYWSPCFRSQFRLLDFVITSCINFKKTNNAKSGMAGVGVRACYKTGGPSLKQLPKMFQHACIKNRKFGQCLNKN